MAQDFSSLPPQIPPENPPDDLGQPDFGIDEYSDTGPSLPIILLSAATGLGCGIISFYIVYGVLHVRLEFSVGIATLCLLFGMGSVGAGLSAAMGTRSTMANIALSCGLVLLTLLFFGLCMATGAIFATFFYFISS